MLSKHYKYFLWIFIMLQSCNGTRTILLRDRPSTTVPPSLGEQVGFEEYFSDMNLSTSGEVEVYLFNESLYLKATIEKETDDTISVTGLIANKIKSYSTIFTYRLNTSGVNSEIIKIDNDAYLYKVNRNDSLYNSIILSETFNSVLVKDKIEFGSGKLTLTNGKQFNYIVIDDPNRAYLDYITFPTHIPESVNDARCNDKFGKDEECTSGEYEAEFVNYVVFEEIFCRCINGN